MRDVSFWVWLVFLIGWVALRWPAMRRARKLRTRDDRRDTLDIALLVDCIIGLAVLPVAWRLGLFQGVGDRPQGVVPLVLGIAAGAAFLWLFRRSHRDLGRNWSVSLELREGHRLVTGGVYAHVRHPMYASFFLWGIMQALLVANWFAGLAGLFAVTLLYAMRTGREEAMMRSAFGAEYEAYAARTRRLLPGVF
jgi:protein-S-isoprenylcysteine O-methyltransferase Ste14